MEQTLRWSCTGRVLFNKEYLGSASGKQDEQTFDATTTAQLTSWKALELSQIGLRCLVLDHAWVLDPSVTGCQVNV